MTFTILCLLLISAFVNASPHRSHEPLEQRRSQEPLERDTLLTDRNRIQEPLDRKISMGNLLDPNTAFSRAGLDYYLDIMNDYKDYVPKEVQMIFAGWWGRIFEAVSAPPNMLANRLADLMADFYEAYSKCAPSVKSEVRTIWPEGIQPATSPKTSPAPPGNSPTAVLSMDIHLLSADADYPPKAPKVKITDRSFNRQPFTDDSSPETDLKPRQRLFNF
ncbi:hypothetical protein OSTOST_22776 [Ostertagia ostertagi]